MANHGGSRAGSGRKPRAEKYQRPINAAEKQIADRLPQLVDRLFELADGVTVQETDPKTGEVNVYTREPNFKALQYLMDRVMGKPEQVKEPVTGDTQGPLRIEVVAVDYREQVGALGPGPAQVIDEGNETTAGTD